MTRLELDFGAFKFQYSIKKVKRINKQIWYKISSKNEWINSKYLNLFKKVD